MMPHPATLLPWLLPVLTRLHLPFEFQFLCQRKALISFFYTNIVEISSRWETLPNAKGWRLRFTTDCLPPCPTEGPAKELSTLVPQPSSTRHLTALSSVLHDGAQGPCPTPAFLLQPHQQRAQATEPLTCLCSRGQAGTLTLTARMVTLPVEKQGEHVSHAFHKHLLGFCCVPGAGPQGRTSQQKPCLYEASILLGEVDNTP